MSNHTNPIKTNSASQHVEMQQQQQEALTSLAGNNGSSDGGGTLTATPTNAPIDNRRIFDEIQHVNKNHNTIVKFIEQLSEGVQELHSRVETLSRQVNPLVETVRTIDATHREHSIQLRDLRATRSSSSSESESSSATKTASSPQTLADDTHVFCLVTNPNGVKLWTRVSRDVELTIPYGHALLIATPFFRQWLDTDDVDAGIPSDASPSFEKNFSTSSTTPDKTITHPNNKVEALCARVVFQKLPTELYSSPSSFEQRQLILSMPIHRMYVALEYPTRHFSNVKLCGFNLPPLNVPIVTARDPTRDNALQCVKFEGVKTIVHSSSSTQSLIQTSLAAASSSTSTATTVQKQVDTSSLKLSVSTTNPTTSNTIPSNITPSNHIGNEPIHQQKDISKNDDDDNDSDTESSSDSDKKIVEQRLQQTRPSQQPHTCHLL